MSDIQRDYDLADSLEVDTAERMKALGDPLRMTIADLVLERAMSVTELAERLDRPRGTIAYHVDLMVAAGLLQVVRTRKVRAIDERLYGRAARTYVFHHQPGQVPFVHEMIAEVDLAAIDEPNAKAASTFTFRHARIPIERAGEFAARLDALALEFVETPRGGDTEYGLYLGLFPTNRLQHKDPA